MSAIHGLEKCEVGNNKITWHFSSDEKAIKFAGIIFPYCGDDQYAFNCIDCLAQPRRNNRIVTVGVACEKGGDAFEKIGRLIKSKMT